jgi:hypothetical protein
MNQWMLAAAVPTTIPETIDKKIFLPLEALLTVRSSAVSPHRIRGHLPSAIPRDAAWNGGCWFLSSLFAFGTATCPIPRLRKDALYHLDGPVDEGCVGRALLDRFRL